MNDVTNCPKCGGRIIDLSDLVFAGCGFGLRQDAEPPEYSEPYYFCCSCLWNNKPASFISKYEFDDVPF